VDLADGRRFAVRPSGTEPKIKYYLFGKGENKDGVQKSLDALWEALEEDAYQRME
jgi:phosphoglucomutase